MDVVNVARSVVFMATVTLEANVQFLTVMATKMPFVLPLTLAGFDIIVLTKSRWFSG